MEKYIYKMSDGAVAILSHANYSSHEAWSHCSPAPWGYKAQTIVSITEHPESVSERGVSDGYDSANYGEAYGYTEEVAVEAERRGSELYPSDPIAQSYYAAGFVQGADDYLAETMEEEF